MYWYHGNLIDKNTLELSLDDSGFLYGATVFTTLRIYHQSLDHPLTNWQKHCDRLSHSIIAFDWPQPNWHNIKQGAELLKDHFPVLRITIFADGRELIIGRNLPTDLEEKQQQGIIAWVANYEYGRILPNNKTGNYLGAWLALQTAIKLGAKEAILTNQNGDWLETSTGNLWGYKQGQWFTPSLDVGILPGIARYNIIEKLKNHGQIVEETIWNEQLIKELEIIAYSNSVVEIIPIHTVIIGEEKLSFSIKNYHLKALQNRL
jgi:4-amino-4-deoxychorismate lyase